MAKVVAICGKICSGKTYYAFGLKESSQAVILSCDELTNALFDNDLGDAHDDMSKRIWAYFMEKSVEIVRAGCDVILDWGFWTRMQRREISEFFLSRGIECQWHYVDVDSSTWQRNISERNARIEAGNGGFDYYLDEGLSAKLLGMWQEPSSDEIDVWYTLRR